MQLTQVLSQKALLIVFLTMVVSVATMALAYNASADNVTGVNNIHRVHVFAVDGKTFLWHVVIVRTRSHTTAVKESIEEGGGVGGYHLRMYYHTNEGEIERMNPCGNDVTRYPFCMNFTLSTIKNSYWPNGNLWFIYFRQTKPCINDSTSIYYCKHSRANYASHDLEFYAQGQRSVVMTKGYPKWQIFGHGGGQTLKNTRYRVHDN